MKWRHNIFIGLGSNLGNRKKWLDDAILLLQNNDSVLLCGKKSSVYETAPIGYRKQPSFLNQVIEVSTILSPQSLLALLLKIETDLGRVRLKKWGPRNIDLDLLVFDQYQSDSAVLRLPHREIPFRRFVLLPWAEIAPDFELHLWNRTVKKMLEACTDDSKVIRQKQKSTENDS